MPLAHPQQRCSLHAAQLLLPMQLNGIDDPGHSDLRQHAIPPAHTGQIVCSQTRTYLVSATTTAARVDASRRVWEREALDTGARTTAIARGRGVCVPALRPRVPQSWLGALRMICPRASPSRMRLER